MSILIKDMEMPTEGYIDVRIFCDGTASFAIAKNPYFKAVEAVPVPPHGRLIDADAILKKCEFVCTDDDEDIRAVRYSIIENAPTVIPASEKDE